MGRNAIAREIMTAYRPRLLRPLLALTLGLALFAGAAPPAGAQLTGAATTWAHAGADIPADPAVTFGQLPNGMRYALQRNTNPPGQVSMRLQIDAGAINEAAGQEGLAHFLEHMAFRGSTALGEREIIERMQRLGLSFGGDTNASTGQRTTTYKFDLPKADDEHIDTALLIFREIGSELKLEQRIMDEERGVVLSEERSRGGPETKVGEQFTKFVFGDHPYSRPIIGQTEVLRTAPVSRMRQFYEAYYRPEHAVLIVVGDIDVAAVEAKIKARFSDWRGKGAPGAYPPANYATRGSAVMLAAEPGVSSNFNVIWRNPPDTLPQGKARERQTIIDILAFNTFNRRLSDIARSPNPPFLGASGGSSNYREIVRLTTLGAGIARPDDWPGALDALIRAQRQALEYGIRQDELDRAITAFRTSLQSAVASYATRRTPGIAESIAGAAAGRAIYTSAAQDLALFEEIVPTLTLAQVNQALRARFIGDGPLIFVAGPTPIPGGQAAVEQRLAQALTAPVTALAAETVKPWTYTDFGAAGQIAERREAEFGATFIRFANGVRLTVKPTKFTADQILVRVSFGDGQLSLPTDAISPARLWGGMFIEGGLKDLTAIERQRTLTGKRVSVAAGAAEDAFVFSGSTRPADLDLQMQLLAAYFTAPGWRTDAYEKMRSTVRADYEALETNPGAVLGRNSGLFLHSGDKRWADPGPDGTLALKFEDARAFIEPIMARAPMEVVIVGDTTVDAAIAATARTFGALPKRDERKPPPAKALDVRFPATPAQPLVWTHKGRPDQALAMMVWPTTGFYPDVKQPRSVRIMQLILQDRLTKILRDKLGETYSPSSDSAFSEVYPNYGVITVVAEVKPDKVQTFYDTVVEVAQKLRTEDVTPDELDRAKKPRIEALSRQMTTNSYWVGVLTGAQEDPRKLKVPVETVPLMESVTIADVREAAETWLAPARAVRMSVVPEAARVAQVP